MCHQVAKHFLCLCPHRNDASRCAHAECLRIRAEAAIEDEGGVVGTGWYTRSSPRGGQRHRVWEPYAVVWEHCVAYRLQYTDKETGRVVAGFEEICGFGKRTSVKDKGDDEGKGKRTVEIRWEMGLCQDCLEGHLVSKKEEGKRNGDGVGRS
ncbi:hypothetical protein C8A03DRAFT_41912 [Achaetomium macrosporum]|uniref:Uncharacterized protein n=1 Tax=Achaetomium macrosporum TaxID=79813 RepID=A0AAN7CEJ4_9PEZI|nr:hypothetical protein C8A03DRAFT_41912 [Achaetomium macrosporum]